MPQTRDKNTSPGNLFKITQLPAVTAPIDTDTLIGVQAAAKTTAKKYTLTQIRNALNATNVGTAGTGVTAVEYGDSWTHTTILTLAGVAFTIGDTAALADGALIYTFPAGPLVIRSASISVGLTLTTGTPTTDTPEIGLGTVIATGANATLGAGAATYEDIMAGASTPVMTDVAGTAELFTWVADLKVETADAHTVHLNIADTWANVDDTAATAAGTVTLRWERLPLS